MVGGTSVGAPTFAGIVAILNQATQSSTKTPPGLGNINPTLYTLAVTTPSAFHDITTGQRLVPCTSGTPTSGSAATRCPTTAPFQIGYNAGTGYDLVTGLGTVDANVLVTSWPGFVVRRDFPWRQSSHRYFSGTAGHLDRDGNGHERIQRHREPHLHASGILGVDYVLIRFHQFGRGRYRHGRGARLSRRSNGDLTSVPQGPCALPKR